MEKEAQAVADRCEDVRERGTNTFYNTTQLSQDMSEVFTEILTPWMSSADVQQVRYHHYNLTASNMGIHYCKSLAHNK